MVDIDDLQKETGKSKSSSKSSSSKSGSSSGGSGESPKAGSESGAFSLDGDDVVEPGDNTMARTSKEWADDHGELNYGKKGSESLQGYMNRQVKEVGELHDNIREMARNNNENFERFTLFMHAMLLNFSQNRVGIMETIRNQFGKDKREALELTNKICMKAGEDEFMEKMVRDMTENLADL